MTIPFVTLSLGVLWYTIVQPAIEHLGSKKFSDATDRRIRGFLMIPKYAFWAIFLSGVFVIILSLFGVPI